MRVLRLSVRHFRNIASLAMEPDEAVNVICADNAQGKTNLLEAVWMFCGGRSFRGARESEFLPAQGGIASLELAFFAGNREQTAQLVFGEDKKKVHLNEVPLRRPTELAGSFCAVVFSPDHLWIVKQGPGKRRQFLDTGLSQIYPKYQRALDSYERILRQRGVLIRDVRAHPQLLETLDAWDNHLAEYGAYITAMRARYTKSLAAECARIYRGISMGKEELDISYASGYLDAQEEVCDRERCRDKLLQVLRDNRAEDMRQGATTKGPHRDDMLLHINGLSARSFASQGQQRSCVLAFKLAECELLAKAAGESPVVLLDDVMSELDEKRREYLLNHLENRQVFITCCDSGAYGGLRRSRIFAMEAGAITGSRRVGHREGGS